MFFCKNCGKALSDTAEFCPNCGTATGRRASAGTGQNAPAGGSYQPGSSYNPGYGAANRYQTGYSTQNTQNPYQNRSTYGYGGAQGQYGYQAPRRRKSPLIWIIVGIMILSGIGRIASALFSSSSYSGGSYGHHNYYSGGGSSSGSGSSSSGGSSSGSGSYSGTGIYSTDLPTTGLRNFYVNTDNAQSVTFMLYMVGSNLESEHGCATDDLIEIANASYGDNVNVIIQTGGTTYWHNDVISSRTVQRWSVKDGQFTEIDDLGNISMLTASALRDFISYSASNYPADRYILVMWDHGGGSLYGFGYDELHKSDSMYLTDIYSALRNANVKFDIIGFDACLMATIETACALEPFADYMVASEETEPGTGWYYTKWLSALGDDPAISSVELGRMIVDDFISHNSKDDTLSVVSLREVPRVYERLSAYLESAKTTVLPTDYTVISTARANAKSYADGEYDLVDILDFSTRIKALDSDPLSEAVASAVKYRNNCSIQGSCGLSMYFPYTDLEVYSYARNIFSQVGYSGGCISFFDDFVNVLANGQVTTYRTTGDDNVTIYEDEATDVTEYDWYNPDIITHEQTTFSVDERLEIVRQEDGTYLLTLTDEEWEIITGILLEAMYDDGNGYIYLGSDQYFSLDDNDNLIVSYDNTWVSINGTVVAYYANTTSRREDGTMVFTGYVPALLNGETRIDVMLKYDDENPGGYVVGYRTGSEENGVQGRNYLQFEDGDRITFLYEYYSYNGEYQDSYTWPDHVIVYDSSVGLTTSYEDVGSRPVRICYRITDVYCNNYWTEELIYQ